MLVIDGGTVKTEADGVVTGFGIVFGSEADPDQSSMRDFFTEDTFITKRKQFEVPLYYEHGLGPIKTEVGTATLIRDKNGWKATAQIDTSDDLGKTVYEAVKEKPHGFSTGALQHLVKRESRQNNTNFIKQWVVGEISLTERPAERKAVVETIKSVNGEFVREEFPIAESEAQDTLQITLYAEDNVVWSSTDAEKGLNDLTETPTKIELKYVDGSVTYSLRHYDEASGKGVEMTAYEWGGTDDLISRLQNMINTASVGYKKDLETKSENVDLDEKIKSVVKSMLEGKDEGEDLKELRERLEANEKELAEVKTQLSDREDALTKASADLEAANKEIAQLKIFAGATETINKYKGN